MRVGYPLGAVSPSYHWPVLSLQGSLVLISQRVGFLVDVAQLAERWSEVPEVAGSVPAIYTMTKRQF